MKKLKKTVIMLLVAIMVLLAGCSSNPCDDCGSTPSKGYKNDNTGEKEYYCGDCSSECNLCYDDADRHYTGGGGIIFICNDCYDELKDYGWIS